MKKIALFTALTMGVSPLPAQPAPNREGIGDVPNSIPAGPKETTPGSPDKPQGESRAEVASESPDERFVRKAGKAGLMEVEIAEWAVTKATREDLKSFAATLVKDHSAANAELAAIARSMGLEILGATESGTPEIAGHAKPGSDPSRRQKTQITPDDPSKQAGDNTHHALKETTGIAFDAAFMEAMDECHINDIALFEKAKGDVRLSTLKVFVDKSLPVLKTHASALTALKRKDPNRPDAKTGSPASDPAGTPNPALPTTDAPPRNP